MAIIDYDKETKCMTIDEYELHNIIVSIFCGTECDYQKHDYRFFDDYTGVFNYYNSRLAERFYDNELRVERGELREKIPNSWNFLGFDIIYNDDEKIYNIETIKLIRRIDAETQGIYKCQDHIEESCRPDSDLFTDELLEKWQTKLDKFLIELAEFRKISYEFLYKWTNMDSEVHDDLPYTC